MYMDDIKPFVKNEKLEFLIRAVRIHSRDIGIEFGIEICAMLVMKSGKRHLTGGGNYQIKTRLKRSERRKSTNTWTSWRLTPSGGDEGKKIRKNISGELESYTRQNYLAETLSDE